MKFRNRGNDQVSNKTSNFESLSQEQRPETREPKRGRWSTTFLVVGSALLGATAIAFWNRRTIATMRAQIQTRSENPVLPPRFEDEIF